PPRLAGGGAVRPTGVHPVPRHQDGRLVVGPAAQVPVLPDSRPGGDPRPAGTRPATPQPQGRDQRMIALRPRHGLLAGLALILLSNAVALGGAWYNRQGEAESRLQLSERELWRSHDGPRRENS